MLTNGAMPVTVATITCRRNSGRKTNTPFARGLSVTVSPTRSLCSNGVSWPFGGQMSSTNSSISGSCGDETIEYGRSMPSTPIVQYWPGSNAKRSRGSSHSLKWSGVKSTRFTIEAVGSFAFGCGSVVS